VVFGVLQGEAAQYIAPLERSDNASNGVKLRDGPAGKVAEEAE